jgi:hypothetical protein
MKNKDLIMLGIIVGIAFFFVGGMINSTFEGDEDNHTPYKLSSAIKLAGLGVLISTLIIGGIIDSDLNKYFKITLLIIGLVLLLIFTLAGQFMKWDISSTDDTPIEGASSSDGSNQQTAYEKRPATPGFEIVLAILAILSILGLKKINKKDT